MEKTNPLSHTQKTMDRRSFLKLSGLLGLGLASPAVIPAAAEAIMFNRKMYKVSDTRLAMGTFVSMTLIHPSKDEAQEAIGRAFEEIDRLSHLMNRFDDSTLIAQLNREGYAEGISKNIADVLSASLHYYRITNGSFDISVKPVVDLFQEKFSDGKNIPPSDSELQKALKRVGSDKIALKDGNIEFNRRGMGITLDGIAKGYIVDKASEILDNHKVTNHLINAGGDIRTMGTRQDKKPWVIAIQDPNKKRQYPDIIQMNHGAIATSGNYEVYYDKEKMFHHIVNPRTGLSPELNTSVSITARTTMDADALSTSVFVMDPSEGTRFINRIQGCECMVVAKGNKKFKSAGWKSVAT
jgi:thiamine biosynthesis lipoprotein